MLPHTHTQKIIKEKRRRLQKLKEQAARLGINTPPEILTEIEDIEAELETLPGEPESSKTSPSPLPPQSADQARHAERIRMQLEQFYRPIYHRLWNDQAEWQKILGVREAPGSLEYRLAKHYEENVVIPNHNQIVAIIDTHFSLADADEELLNLLQQYKKDVGEYKALRSVGEQTLFSTEKSDDDWWHQDLFNAIKERMDRLEQEYRELTGGTTK